MTSLMGILNLTPDSFSGDGHSAFPVEQQLMRVDELMVQGAEIIDVGAESTRPGARVLTADEEWERIAPLAAALGRRLHQRIFSIDTYHPETAERALQAGFHWLNDVRGAADGRMLHVAAAHAADIVLMHSLAVPASPALTLPADADPVEEVLAWGMDTLQRTDAAGIAREKVILDIGIGFGKTPPQSLALLRGIERFREWGVRLLVGHSRKSFLAAVLGDAEAPRDAATLAVSAFLASRGVDYLRVHDVASHRALHTVQEVLR